MRVNTGQHSSPSGNFWLHEGKHPCNHCYAYVCGPVPLLLLIGKQRYLPKVSSCGTKGQWIRLNGPLCNTSALRWSMTTHLLCLSQEAWPSALMHSWEVLWMILFLFSWCFCLIGPNLLTCNEWNIKVNTFMTTITLWGLTSKIGLSLHLFWLSLHLVQLMLGPQFYIFIAVPHCKQHIALALSHNVMIHHTTAVQLMLCAWLWLLLQHPDDSNT